MPILPVTGPVVCALTHLSESNSILSAFPLIVSLQELSLNTSKGFCLGGCVAIPVESFGKMKVMTTSATREEAIQNHLLAGVSDEELARLLPNLQPLTLPLGEVLYESGEKMDYVYFPTTAIISLLYIMENGSSAEIGVVGNDGLVGIAIFMGGDTTPNRAVVQSAGTTFKMRAASNEGGVHARRPFS